MWITGSQILLVGLLHRTLPLDSSLQFTPQHSIQSHTKSRKVTPIPFDLHASVCLCTMVQCFFFIYTYSGDILIIPYMLFVSTFTSIINSPIFFPTAKYPPPIPSPSDYKRIRSTSKCFSTSLIISTLLPI